LIAPSYDQRSLELKYKSEQASYEFTPQMKVMLLRMLNYSNFSPDLQSYPLAKIFTDLCQELIMTELEISGFVINLSRFFWPMYNQSMMLLLYSVAFVTKVQFNHDTDPLLNHLCSKIPSFITFFNSWMQNNDEYFEVNLKDLNRTFETLTKKPFNDVEMNHNFYVDHILEIAPASTYEKKWWQNELSAPVEQAFPDPPAMIKLDSVFCDMPVLGFQRNISVGSACSGFTLLEFPEI
jgi:hypothetical protein